ncbi:MAG TPA: GNAT family N-acetyltransferase, partial [Solirubrobacteraceae bacterium]|nr:GNAT family N-acetyltransferase [Solirubrobacteraceae bacterium]
MELRAVNAGEPPASDLIEAMVREMEPLYGRIDVPDMPSGRPEDFGPPGGAFVVGFDGGGRAVCGGGVKRLEDGVAEIKRMYVVPEARGRGVARALLGALEDAARSLGYERVRLDVGPKQPAAEHLYRSAGYREIADYNGNYQASFWGEKRLRWERRRAARTARRTPTPRRTST